MQTKASFLLIEDDEVDIKAALRAFKQVNIIDNIYVAKDGVHALDKLRNQEIPQPYIIIIDINLPGMNGIDFLKMIRKDRDLLNTIVFVLTTSSDQIDINNSYNRNVAGYITKPDDDEGFITIARMISEYSRIISFPN